jgi:hypothetical protein
MNSQNHDEKAKEESYRTDQAFQSDGKKVPPREEIEQVDCPFRSQPIEAIEGENRENDDQRSSALGDGLTTNSLSGKSVQPEEQGTDNQRV